MISTCRSLDGTPLDTLLDTLLDNADWARLTYIADQIPHTPCRSGAKKTRATRAASRFASKLAAICVSVMVTAGLAVGVAAGAGQGAAMAQNAEVPVPLQTPAPVPGLDAEQTPTDIQGDFRDINSADALPATSTPTPLAAVILDPTQRHIDLTSVVTRLPADREATLAGPVPLVLTDEEADFARVWSVFALQNPQDVPQQRIITIDRSALWASGIAPVRSGLTQLGAWRVTPPGSATSSLDSGLVTASAVPQPVSFAGQGRPGDVRFLVSVPPASTVSFAIPNGSSAETPIHVWTRSALAAADSGRSVFAGLIVGVLAIAFIFFAAQWAQQFSGYLRGGSAGAIAPAYGAVRLAALLTGGALFYELSAQGLLASIFGWSAAWDTRVTGLFLALASGACAHVLAAERIRALLPEREQLARLTGWVALASGILVLLWPTVGLPFVRLMAFSIALGGVAALTAGNAETQSGAPRLTPAAGELRAGWALLAVAALLAALASQGFLPRSVAVEMIIHALAILGVLVAAYALAGPSTLSAVRTAARRSMALGRTVNPNAPAAPEIALPGVGAIRAEQRNALALAGASEAVWDLDVTSGTLYVDPSLEAHLGLVPGALCGRLETWMARVDRDDRRHVSRVLDENVERGNATFTLEMRVSHADPLQGSRWLELKATCFAGDDAIARRCVGTIGDITERREEQAGLVRETLNDPLTGLSNRPLFTDRLHRACIRAQGSHERIALVLADLDRFKSVNESLGHAAADTVLSALAQRLKALIAPEDTLARIDGDTFAMLVAGWTDETGPAEIAQLMSETISQPLEVAGREIFPTASVGFTVREPHHDRGETLLGEADLALRLAKRQGNAVLQFNPNMRPADDELATESGLRRALERGEIQLAYQPIVTLDTGRLAGFEALIRWHHPERGIISPDEFIPLAERSGLIIELGGFVLDQATADLAVWQKDFPQEPALFSSVNISSRQLLDDLPAKISGLLERTALAEGSLRLEVTESLVMNDPEHAAQVLTDLKATGAKLALDDFGTGYSSLSYLQRFPFDVVKIDKSFVQAMGDDADQDAIVRSVLTLASDLKLSVVAEGVEDDSARVSLAKLGCTFGQGFLFGQPMDAADAHDFIARNMS